MMMLTMLGGAAHAQSRIATANVGVLFTNYYRFKQLSASLDNRKNELAKQENDLIDGLKKDRDDYQKLLADANNQAVSAEEREKRKTAAEDKLKDIQDAQDDLQKFDAQAHSILTEQSMRMRDNLVGDIMKVVKAKALEGHFTLVLDSTPQASSGLPVVLYSTENDITDAVLKQLNANAPIDTPSTDTTKPDTKSDSK